MGPHRSHFIGPGCVDNPCMCTGLGRATRDMGFVQVRMNRLPDYVLGEILSRLPTGDAVLSSRWRHVWRSSPINLDDRYLRGIGGHRISAAVCLVSHVLALHPGPGRRLRIETVLIAGLRRVRLVAPVPRPRRP